MSRGAPEGRAVTRAVRRILASSRYFIVVAVVGSFAASAAALVYGGLATAKVVLQTFWASGAATSTRRGSSCWRSSW